MVTGIEHLAARLTQLEAEVRTLHGALLALGEQQGWRLPPVPEAPAPLRPVEAAPEASLRERRLALGLSQEALARAAGYSRRAVAAIEQGQRSSPDARLRLHEALGALDQGADRRPEAPSTPTTV